MTGVNAITNLDKTDNNIKTTNKSSAVKTDFSSYLGETKSLDDIFQKAANKYNVDVDLLKAIGKAESNFNENATSRCGAQGVMQLMPATAKSLGVQDSYDAEQNIMGGAKYISGLLKKYDGDTKIALAAYNAGSGNVRKYGGIPPFKETQNYVKKVMNYYDKGVDTNGITTKSDTTSNAANTSKTAAVSASAATVITNPESTTRFVSLASTGATQDETQQVLDAMFSYEDYLDFLLKYSEKEESEEKSSEYALGEINYNFPVLNLLNTIS